MCCCIQPNTHPAQQLGHWQVRLRRWGLRPSPAQRAIVAGDLNFAACRHPPPQLLERLLGSPGARVGLAVVHAMLDQPECLRYAYTTAALGNRIWAAQFFWDAGSNALK